MARNYVAVILASGQIGGSPVSVVVDDADELALATQFWDPGSQPFQPTPVWFGFDKGLFKDWINRAIGSELYEPTSDVEPVIFTQSPIQKGNQTFEGENISFTPPSDKKGGGKTTYVPPETLLRALQTFAGVLVSAGYKTGGRPNLLTRLIVFIIAVKNNKPYDADALSLLLEQIALVG